MFCCVYLWLSFPVEQRLVLQILCWTAQVWGNTKEKAFLNEGTGDFWMTGHALTNRRWISSPIENKTHWATSCSTACSLQYLTLCRTIREVQYRHTYIMHPHTPLSPFTWWVICHSASIQILHGIKIHLKKNWSCTPWLSCFLSAWRKGPAVGHDCTTTLTQLIWSLIKKKVRCFHEQLTKLIHVPCILPRRRIQMLSQDNNNSLTLASHIHNIPLPQHDTSTDIKTNGESSRWHQWNAMFCSYAAVWSFRNMPQVTKTSSATFEGQGFTQHSCLSVALGRL